MAYLIDTDWVADWLKGRATATDLLATIVDDGLAISLITYGEILEGVYFGSHPAAHEAAFELFLQEVDVLDLDEAIMPRFARLRGQLGRLGQKIGDFDTLIAATALHDDLVLVTRNLQHFQRVPDLRIYSLA